MNSENGMPWVRLRAQATRAVANKATDMKEIQIRAQPIKLITNYNPIIGPPHRALSLGATELSKGLQSSESRRETETASMYLVRVYTLPYGTWSTVRVL